MRTRPSAADRFWAIGFPGATALAAVLVVGLLLAGRSAVLQNTEGDSADVVADPAAPGWQALAEPTPTLAVLHDDADGALVGVTLLSIPAPGAGARPVPAGGHVGRRGR